MIKIHWDNLSGTILLPYYDCWGWGNNNHMHDDGVDFEFFRDGPVKAQWLGPVKPDIASNIIFSEARMMPGKFLNLENNTEKQMHCIVAFKEYKDTDGELDLVEFAIIATPDLIDEWGANSPVWYKETNE
jgi:hypothetical protein